MRYIFLVIKQCDDPFYSGSTVAAFESKAAAVAWLDNRDVEMLDAVRESKGAEFIEEDYYFDWREEHSIQEMRVQGA